MLFMKKRVSVKPSLLEEVRHFEYSYPVFTDYMRLWEYENLSFACHWHSELEFTVVLEGAMEYTVDDMTFVAEAGTGVLANSNVLHNARSLNGGDCSYLVVIIDPVMIYGFENSSMERYVDEFLHTHEFRGVVFSDKVEWQRELMKLLCEIGRLNAERSLCFELEIKSRLCSIWSLLYKNTVAASPNSKYIATPSIPHLKQSLEFIHRHYSEKIALSDIARAGNVSSGECCRIFKKTLRQSPVQYLLSHRVRKSLSLLQDDSARITEIAYAVGFSNPSYFTEVFHARMNTTPRAYREAVRKERENAL